MVELPLTKLNLVSGRRAAVVVGHEETAALAVRAREGGVALADAVDALEQILLISVSRKFTSKSLSQK
jgi:hypothetical protein